MARDAEAKRRYDARYRAANREKRLAQARISQRATYAANPQLFLKRSKAWRARNPANQQQRDLRRFNLTPEQYDQLFQKQSGVCAICKKPETRTVKGTVSRLAVDHDSTCCEGHSRSCGACVRGLLCYYCNTAIGLLRDDPVLLEEAMFYLAKAKIVRHGFKEAA